jgi:hypothetical protein
MLFGEIISIYCDKNEKHTAVNTLRSKMRRELILQKAVRIQSRRVICVYVCIYKYIHIYIFFFLQILRNVVNNDHKWKIDTTWELKRTKLTNTAERQE